MPHVRSALFVVVVSSLVVPEALSAQTVDFGKNMPKALVHYRLGSDNLARELWEPAAREFTAAVKSEPLFTDAHYGLAQAYMGLRRYTSAIQAFERLIKAAQTVHGLRLRYIQDDAHAVPLLFEVPAPALLALGSAHFHSGHRAEAEHYWLEAAKVNPRLGEAWNNLAVTYLTSGRRTEAQRAVAHAERAGFRVNPKLKADIDHMIGEQ